MKKILYILLIALFLPLTVNSQSIWNSGSVYSYIGYGLPNDYQGDFTNAMGVYGVAMNDSRLSNKANPAIWGHATFSNISGGLILRSHQVSDNTGTAWNNQIAPAQIQGVFPISRDNFGISFSLAPIVKSGFNMDINGSLAANENNSGEELPYTLNREGFGSLNALEVGFGWRVTPNISVGYAPSFVFGTYQTDSSISFDNADYNSSSYSSYTNNVGFRNRFGIYSTLPGFGRSSSRLFFGATANLPVNLSVNRTIESRIGIREINIAEPDDFTLDGSLPAEFAFGMAYQFNSITTFSTDLVFQNWSESTSVDQHSEFEMSDRIRIGAGTQINASRIPGEPSLVNRFNYRFGASYDTGHLKNNDGNVQTILFHAGLGIPSSSQRSASSVNINFEFGFRGTEINGALNEYIFGVNLSLSLSELMFIRSRIQ